MIGRYCVGIIRDDSLHEAVDMARGSSAAGLKLIVSAKLDTLAEGDDDNSVEPAAGSTSNTLLIGGGLVVGLGLLAVVAMTLSKAKK